MADAHELLKRRIIKIRGSEVEGKCVLYVMSRDQRVQDNHALIAAQKHALAKKLPLAVVFCLLERSGYRSREHYAFMLSGLREAESHLRKLGIPFMLVIGDPKERLSGVMHHTEPDAVYFDFNPLRGPRALLAHLAEHTECGALYCVDAHNIVPVWKASDKQEFAAHTIRRKLHVQVGEYLVEPDVLTKHPYVWPGRVQSIDMLQERIDAVLQSIKPCGVTSAFKSGEHAAGAALEDFIENRLHDYAQKRNDPTADSLSGLSPYLHFGQISSLRIALRLRQEVGDLHILTSPTMPRSDIASKKASVDALLEELIVRKELSDNFCYYEKNYDALSGAAEWVQNTLRDHGDDPREHLYTYEQLETAQTHDNAWNAAQRQMTATGKMHGYMRMYWAKKVLEWTESPEQAITFLIRLNDTYSIDGGDPNGYVGILWSVAGVHDRPWTERPVFGKIRYMNYAGLKRKFDIESYCRQWS